MSRVAGGRPQAEAGKRLAGTTRSAAYEYLENITTGNCRGTNAAAPCAVVQSSECILNHCHSEPILSARNLLLEARKQIPRAIIPRFGMTILNRHPYCTTTQQCAVPEFTN